jgi:hypothetical protein
VAIALLAGEVGLRLYFWGGGTRTLGAPGGRFETLMRKGDLRAPLSTLPKEPGITRILVQGDSITWGLGVRDWKDIYPNRLLDLLNADGVRYDMAVLSAPGREIDAHLAALLRLPDTTAPDILVYQWYVNDIELVDRRPDNTRRWQRWRWHEPLKAWSYLYFFLDWRFATLLRPPDRSYTQYLLDEFKEGGDPWSDFRRVFHNWAVNAARLAPRRILLLYPQLPFSGAYPLQSIHDRMEQLAAARACMVPVWTFGRRAGNSLADGTATYGVSRRHAPGDGTGWLFFSPPFALPRGHHTVRLRARLDQEGTGTIGRFEATRGEGRQVVSGRDVTVQDLAPAGAWVTLELGLDVTEPVAQDVEFRFAARDAAALSLDTVSFDVDYGLEVVDPIDRLAAFDTHASIFDAHPNERAHQVLADVLAKAIQKR